MFTQFEKLQETVWGRLFIVTIFPLLVFLALVALTVTTFVAIPILSAVGLVVHGQGNYYTRNL